MNFFFLFEFMCEFVKKFFTNFVHKSAFEIPTNLRKFVRIHMIFLHKNLAMLRMACTVEQP